MALSIWVVVSISNLFTWVLSMTSKTEEKRRFSMNSGIEYVYARCRLKANGCTGTRISPLTPYSVELLGVFFKKIAKIRICFDEFFVFEKFCVETVPILTYCLTFDSVVHGNCWSIFSGKFFGSFWFCECVCHWVSFSLWVERNFPMGCRGYEGINRHNHYDWENKTE